VRSVGDVLSAGNIRSVTFYRSRRTALGISWEIKEYKRGVLRRAGRRLLLDVAFADRSAHLRAAPSTTRRGRRWMPGPIQDEGQAADIARIGVRITDCTGGWRRGSKR